MHAQVADSKLLKILAKIAGKLTDLKDVITITEPCARKPNHSPPCPPEAAPTFVARSYPCFARLAETLPAAARA